MEYVVNDLAPIQQTTIYNHICSPLLLKTNNVFTPEMTVNDITILKYPVEREKKQKLPNLDNVV